MQVNSSNGSLQQRIFSGAGSIGGVHLPILTISMCFPKRKAVLVMKNTENRL